MRLCPHHGLEKWLIIHGFYNGLLYITRMTVDAADEDALMDKPFSEAYQLTENMAHSHYQWGSKRIPVEKSQAKCIVYEVGGLYHMSTIVDALTQKINNLTITPAVIVADVTPLCEICGVQGHVIIDC